MFKAIGWLIKVTIFAGIILVLGNMVHWKGHTVSDQVKTSLAAAQQSETLDDIKTWANHVTTPANPQSANHYKNTKRRALLQESPRNAVQAPVAATQPQPTAQAPRSWRSRRNSIVRTAETPRAYPRDSIPRKTTRA